MFVDIYNASNKYDLIYADPPWKQSRGGKKAERPNSSGRPFEYETLSMGEIRFHLSLAASLCEDNCVLFLWTIDKYLFEAQKVAESIGFKLHARMVWNKVTGIPAAFTIRFGHEYLLYMYRGKLLPVEKAQRGKIHSVFTEKVSRHSKKPVVAYQIIESLYPNTRKLELYARNERCGWDCWGNDPEITESACSGNLKENCI